MDNSQETALYKTIIVGKSIVTEQLGSKPKFWVDGLNSWFADCPWLDLPPGKESRMLFKADERNCGDDWAEKVAAEICSLLGLPHVPYHLAKEVVKNRPGVVCPSCAKQPAILSLGNELLTMVDPKYPQDASCRAVRQHTVDNVVKVLRKTRPPSSFWPQPRPQILSSGLDVFVGYVMFDCLIANQDRHHENWGVVDAPDSTQLKPLAPTFDHGAGLARALNDDKRQILLTTRDQRQTLAAFIRRAKSAFFVTETDKNSLTTYAAWQLFAQIVPDAAAYWLSQLHNISEQKLRDIVDKIPQQRLSIAPGREFTTRLVLANKQRLIEGIE